MTPRDKVKFELIKNIILTEAAQTSDIVFSPPSHVLRILQDRNIETTNLYIVRAYARLGIRFVNGLWKRSVEGEK